jgi:diguanylate cyclase
MLFASHCRPAPGAGYAVRRGAALRESVLRNIEHGVSFPKFMLSDDMPFLDTPVRIAVAGVAALIWLSVLVASFAASDVSIAFFDTVRVNQQAGSTVLTRYNPAGLLLFALALAPLLAGAALAGAKFWGVMQGARNRASHGAVQGELARVLDIILKLVNVNSSYRASLGHISGTLGGQSQAAQVRKIIAALLTEYQSMREETQRLSDELEGKQSEKKNVEDRLSQVDGDTRLDTMTGVGNRRAFDQELKAAIQHCRADGIALSLVMTDIDHFKSINDTYGHQIGDEVLKMLARIIRSSVRNSDVACRYGGEEFAIIMAKADLDTAKSVAERIRKRFESRRISIKLSGQSLGRVTASFGIAELRIGDDVQTLTQRADRKLYAAKAAGRNRVMG